MKRLQKFERWSYKDNAKITLNKLFSFEMMLEVNLKANYKEIIITVGKYKTFTKDGKIQLQRECQRYNG